MLPTMCRIYEFPQVDYRDRECISFLQPYLTARQIYYLTFLVGQGSKHEIVESAQGVSWMQSMGLMVF